jgi:hypothetical protein
MPLILLAPLIALAEWWIPRLAAVAAGVFVLGWLSGRRRG